VSNQPPAPEPPGSEPPASRLAAAETALGRLAQEVRTRRLVVVDDRDRERIVAELDGEDAYFRLDLPRREGEGTTGLILYANTGGDVASPSLGLQFWADGNAIGGFEAWRSPDGQWRGEVTTQPPS